MAVKQKRIQLMDRQTELTNMNCSRCTAETCIECPISNELQDIGRKLLELSSEAFDPPAELTWSTYLLLKERGWEDLRMARHYGISKGKLNEFIQLNKNPLLYFEEEQNMVAEQKEQGISLTVERYLELKKQKKSDSKIRKEFGLQVHDFNKFKNKHGLVKKKENISKPAPERDKPLREIAENVSAADVTHQLDAKEPELPKVNPLDEVVAELKAKLQQLTDQNEFLEKESEGLANECNENYQNYIVADAKCKSLINEMETMKDEYSKEIRRMNGLLEESYKDDQYLTQTLERLVIARKTNKELTN